MENGFLGSGLQVPIMIPPKIRKLGMCGENNAEPIELQHYCVAAVLLLGRVWTLECGLRQKDDVHGLAASQRDCQESKNRLVH